MFPQNMRNYLADLPLDLYKILHMNSHSNIAYDRHPPPIPWIHGCPISHLLMSGLGKCGRSTKYSWPVKRNKILTYTTQWMDSENILSKRNQSKSPRVICGSISIEHSRPMNLQERSDWFCAPWFLST